MNASQLCGMCCCISAVTLLFMIISSFSSLEVNELGLDYSSISKNISKDNYSAGFHFLGLGHKFIKFPKTVQQFEFSNEKNADYVALHSRTSDGLEVQLEISFQYRLLPEKLFDIYMNFKDDYKKIFMNMSIDVLTDNATQFGAYQFFIDRQNIGSEMQKALNKHFMENCFTNIEFFQLRSVDLPDKFEESIQVSEVYKQNINKAKAEKEKVLVELDTLIKKAELQKKMIINVAQGDEQSVIKQGEAKAKSFLVKQNANAKSYKTLKQKLSYSGDELVDYVKEKIIRDYEGNDIIVNLGKGTQVSDSQKK